jgi:hypothetical protein
MDGRYPCLHFGLAEPGVPEAEGLAQLLENLAAELRQLQPTDTVLGVTIASTIESGSEFWEAGVYFADGSE